MDRKGRVLDEQEIRFPETVGLWSVRFRFLVEKPFSADELELEYTINGQKLIVACDNSAPLKDAEMVTILAHGFADEGAATDFA